ncbi:MAG: hypothetical protein ABI221_01095 [Candidatus Saccharimonadales bacterium]
MNSIQEQLSNTANFVVEHGRQLVTIAALGGASVALMGATGTSHAEAAPTVTTTTEAASSNDLLFFKADCDTAKPGEVTGSFELQNVPSNPPAELTVNTIKAQVTDAGLADTLYTYTVRLKKSDSNIEGDVSIDGGVIKRIIPTPAECVAVPDTTLPETTTTTIPKTTTTTTIPETTTTTIPETTTTTTVPKTTTTTTPKATTTSSTVRTGPDTLPSTSNPDTLPATAPTSEQASQKPQAGDQAPVASPVRANPNYTG